MLDARHGEVYSALYRRDASAMVEVCPPRLSRPEAVLESVEGESVVFVGPGVTHCSDEIRRSRSWRIGSGEPWLARVIAEMAEAGFLEAFEPLYLRPSVLHGPRTSPERLR
jgi:tRNA A37 threonylcarbamoyladenosine modification protein TsaB